MATKRLKDFVAKTTPTGADIIFLGDAANSFAESKSTISEIILGYSPGLASIADLTTSANQIIYTTASDTFATSSISSLGRNLVAASSAINAQLILELVIGLNVQAYSVALDSIAGLTTAADEMIYTTGSNAYAVTPLTAFARTILDDANGAAVLSTIGALPLTGGTMTGELTLSSSTPSTSLTAASKGYVDAAIGGAGPYLTVANNLSDLNNPTTARSNLGVAIGTNVQAFDATLQSLSSLGTAANKYAYTTALDTWAEGDITAFGRSLIDDADDSTARATLGLGTAATRADAFFLQTANNLSDVVAATARVNLDLEIGVDVQAYNATLQSLSSLGTAADRIVYTTGVNTWAETALTSTARNLLDDTSTAAMLTTLGALPLAGGAMTGALTSNSAISTTSSLGAATLSLSATSNQIVLGTTNTTTISAIAPAASRTYTIQDPLASANFVMSEGIQTINGAKTFGGVVTFNSTIAGAGSNVDLETGNDLRISSTGKLSFNRTDEAYFAKQETFSFGTGIRIQGYNGIVLATGLAPGVLDGGISLSSAWGPRVYIGPVSGGGANAQDRLEVAGGIKLGAAIGNATGSPGAMIDGTIQWNGTNFQGRKNSVWVNLDDSNPSITEYVVEVSTTNTTSLSYNNGTAGQGATLSGLSTGTLTIDSTLITLGMRLLMKDMFTPSNNGVYVCTTQGAVGVTAVLTRVIGFDTAVNWDANQNAIIYVSGGSSLTGTYWKLVPPPPATVGTDSITFAPVNPDSVNSVQPNLIIGGNFDNNPWARGTSSGTGIAGGTDRYVADRFYCAANGSTVDLTKATDAPTVAQCGMQVTHSMRMTVTSSSAQAAGDYLYFGYKMEGYDWAQIAQGYFTVSFWVKATVTGTYSCSFGNSGFDLGYCATFTINTTNTWEKKTIVVIPSLTTGTWNSTNGIGIQMRIWANCGSSNQTSTLNTWDSLGFRAANTQTNGAATNGNIFALSLIKIEKGYGATPYPYELKADVEKKCQRYYIKSYDAGTAPGTAATYAGSIEFCVGGPATNIPDGAVIGTVFFDKMRAAPTVDVYSPANATSGSIQETSKLPTVVDHVVSIVHVGDSSFKVANATGSVMTSGENYAWQWTASAEL